MKMGKGIVKNIRNGGIARVLDIWRFIPYRFYVIQEHVPRSSGRGDGQPNVGISCTTVVFHTTTNFKPP